MMKRWMISFAIVFVMGCSFAIAQTQPADHGIQNADQETWGACPEGLPPGCKTLVRAGDPSKPDLFTLKVWMPDGYKVMPHFHGTAEYLTVISGNLHVGMGEKFDEKNAGAIMPGGFGWMAAQVHHFAWAEGDTVFQIHGMGPFTITYVNPADDPRTKK